MKKFLVILLTGSLMFTSTAFAGRLGGGRNSGMQRSINPSYSNSGYSNSTYSRPQSPNNNSGQQRSGMGAGTAALLGAAAGAAGGYMLGKSSNTNASGVVTSEAQSSIPWGTIIILIAVLALGLMFFRKKTNPGLSSENQVNPFSQNQANSFNIQNITQTQNKQNKIPTKLQILKPGSSAPMPEQIDKMPDGIETVYFLRQAKGMFLHIQSMNNAENLNEIQKYMTTQLFAEIKDEIAQNSSIADFINLDCQLLDCQTVEAGQANDGQLTEAKLVASVKFSGNVSENPEQAPQPFSEIWNFIKCASSNNKWVVAGIQQQPLTS